MTRFQHRSDHRTSVPSISFSLSQRSGFEAGRREDDDRRADEVDGEDPEAQPVDDHRRELPVVRLVLVVGVLLHLLRDEPQFVENGEQLASNAAAQTSAAGSRSAVVHRPDARAQSGEVGHRYGVVDVLYVGDETDRRRRLRLEVAHARLAEEELAREIAPGSGDSQRPGEPLADHLLNLHYSNIEVVLQNKVYKIHPLLV